MKIQTREISYLFDSLKNGDFFAFYHKKWYFLFSRLIKLVSGEPIDHIAGVYDVERSGDDLIFKLGEMNVGIGKHNTSYTIRRIKDEYGEADSYLIDSRFRNKGVKFYYCSNKHRLTKEQNKQLAKYWDTFADYRFGQLPFSINWIYKLFGDKKKIYDHYCNGAAFESIRSILNLDVKDKAQNPAQFTKNEFLNPIVRIIC